MTPREKQNRPVSWLVPYDKNVKKHDDAQVDRIVESIKRWGWTQPILTESDGTIIAGHGRRLAALKLGMNEVPVIVIDGITKQEARALRLADNRTNEGGYDTLMFRDEVADLEALLVGIYDTRELEFSTVDLGELNADAFVADVAVAVEDQEQEAHAKADEVSARRVPLAKVFGFKDVAGADEIHITRFMARAQAETGLAGADALVAFLQRME
ncbi:ParB/Srx family N-terminal domain-containing protein [Burkholderia vietnamiensis]|uniref:ParB/Srx family N-terminal domain-containing protein n=1 Tax=Burkholderia vietnamiensis TaxID=60552 RepID=UPI001CAF1FCB|nr:ParB/Srx family N-terminal domain-containing protein [Burkholderia vietnamiensis]CAG9228768.1 Chromosome partitioning protein ParB [Burkholderia vietnamiensis]HDR9086375.1 ParB N-terminal domain-containing protein [Burkholderia vietnamiensis]